jgi:hypothetical protein
MQSILIEKRRSAQTLPKRPLAGRRLVVAALLCISGASPLARAQDLRWKLKPGEVLRYVMEEKQLSAVKAMDREIKSNRSTTTNLTWTVSAVSATGDAEIALRFERVRMHIEQPPLMPTDLDSSTPRTDLPEPFGSMAQQLKGMAGAEFTFKLKPNGAIEDFKIPEKTLTALRAGVSDPNARNMLSEQPLKDSFLQASPPAFPENASEPGKSWTSKQAKIPAPFGNVVIDKTFTSQGPDPKDPALFLIGTETKVAIEPQGNSEVSAKIQSQEGKGSMAFDTASGRIKSTRIVQKMQLAIASAADPSQKMENTTETTSTMTLEQ